MIHRCALGIGNEDRPGAAPDRVYTNHAVGSGRHDQGLASGIHHDQDHHWDGLVTARPREPTGSTGQWVGQKGRWSLTGYGTKGGSNSSPVGEVQADDKTTLTSTLRRKLVTLALLSLHVLLWIEPTLCNTTTIEQQACYPSFPLQV